MKAFMFTKFTAFILLLLLSVINGCTAKPAGIGSDDGASASENDQLQKNYEVDYPEAVKTSLNLLNSAEFPGGGEITDELKTTIEAVQKDGTHVAIDVVRIEDGLTRVAVRIGTGESSDRLTQQQILD